MLSNSFRPFFDVLADQGFETTQSPDGSNVAVLVQITRSKAETLGLIAQAFRLAQPGGVVIVDGDKTDGIESALKQCREILPADGVISKAHGKLFWMLRPDVLPADLQVWEAGLALTANPEGFMTAPGMFSVDKVDTGSALLAGHFDQTLKGTLADLGAGWGWLSAQALSCGGDISRIDLYEAEQAALEAAKANLTDPRAQFFWSDVRALKTPEKYDAVICNPPFHQSRAAEPAIGLDFIQKAAEILKPTGTLWLVANRQLPYEARLDHCFGRWDTLEETHHFKVIKASRPLAKPSRNRNQKPLKSRQGRQIIRRT